jgi:hypothetical protein
MDQQFFSWHIFLLFCPKDWEICRYFCLLTVNSTHFPKFFEKFAKFWITQNWGKQKIPGPIFVISWLHQSNHKITKFIPHPQKKHWSGPVIGSKSDFWLIWGRCNLVSKSWYEAGIDLILPQVIPDWYVLQYQYSYQHHIPRVEVYIWVQYWVSPLILLL